MDAKRRRLREGLERLGGVVVAFSGGVDSAYLLAEAHDVLRDRCVGATAVSPSLAREELRAARRVAAAIGARHVVVGTAEYDDPRYRRNDGQRCYFCKHALFTRLAALAADLGLPAVAYGANVDDLGDVRPGMRAAAEHRIEAPLLDAGLTKAEIRALARARGLDVWDKPASPCLASRIPLGTPVTMEALRAVEAGERILHGLGFRDIRLRHHGAVARLEVPPVELPRLEEALPRVAAALRALGFARVVAAPRPGRGPAFAPALSPAPAGAGGDAAPP
jgi:uncharacterized protein